MPRRCTTKLKNTHGTEFRELLYPWHPWFGLRVGVHAAIERSSDTIFRCSLSGSDADRWLEVPAWMFDRLACAKVRVADAHIDLTALTNLVALLGHALNDRFTSSNAPLSRISILSRDQNRGKLHATSNEAGAPLCATTGRPVRSRTADDDRRHAGIGPDVRGNASQDEEVGQNVDHIDRLVG